MLHIGRNILSLVLSRILSGVVLFLIYTQLYKYLGSEATGQYGLLASYLTVFSFFVDLGMSQLVIKKMSEDESHIGKYLTNYFLVQFFLGVVFMLIMDGFVFVADYPEQVKNALYVAGLGLLLSSLSLPFRSVVVAKQRLTITARVNFFNAFINAGMMALCIAFNQNIFFLAFISVAVSTFDMLVYGYVVNRTFTKFSFSFDWPFVKQMFIWNTPFMLLTFFSIYNRIDGLILPHFRSFVETGYYTVAYKFWDTLAFFPGILGISLYPFFAQTINQGRLEEAKNGLETYTRYMIAVAVPMSVGAFLLADQIILRFFGAEFLPAAPAFWLLVLAVSFLFIYTPANSLIISQLTGVATKVTAFTFFFNLILNIIFIPKYGFVAAAVITAASELCQTIGYSYFIKQRIVKYAFVRNMWKPLVASFFMAAFLYVFKGQNTLIVVGVAAVIYAISLFVLRFFRGSDLILLKAALSVKKTVTTESPNT
ncbi:MAG: flippase [Candidatus Doudnabacteria bacterium]|nr:flippase [Candidatus Doudnabacteria bacterium]